MSKIVIYILAIIGGLYLLKMIMLLGIHIALYISDKLSEYNSKYVGIKKRSYFGTTFSDWYIVPSFSICFSGINSGITFYWLKYELSWYYGFYTEKDEDVEVEVRRKLTK